MCTQNQPKEERTLRKEDFIIPDDWEPTSPSLKRIIELREKVIGILGPDIIREILEEAGVTPEGDLARESSDSR
ncbi:hypothetical protein H8E77_10345 [bacterium]|nr:hypothetical protein [bacterium]